MKEISNTFLIVSIVLLSVFVVGTIVGVIILCLYLTKNDAIDSTTHKANSRNSTKYGLFSSSLSSEERAGYRGEREVNYELMMIKKIDEYTLSNILIPLKNKHTTEIDCVLVSRKGIFCIETKNWSGRISGSDEGEMWIQQFNDFNRSDKRHKNPVQQNENHCIALSRILNDKFFIENVVIFVNENGTLNVNSEHAFTMRQFKRWYESLDDSVIHPEVLKMIYQKLLKYTATDEELEKHKKDIQNTYKNIS